MNDMEKEFQELETRIMLDPHIYSFDPIQNHRIKVDKLNKAKRDLLIKKGKLANKFLAF